MNSTEELSVVVYTPIPQKSASSMLRTMVYDFGVSHDLGWRLFRRDLAAQYRQSVLGILWAFIPPLMTSLIFILLQSNNIINIRETNVPYPVYVIIGTMLWQVFTESLNAPLKATTAAKPMLAKIHFPRESLIISSFYTSLFGFFVKLVVVIVLMLAFGFQFSWTSLLAIPATIVLVLLGLMIGLYLTPFGMLFTDISSALPVITQLWFFLTPVVYPPPESAPLSYIAMLNPVTPILVNIRDLATQGEMTTPLAFLLVSLIIPAGFFLAWLIYRISLPIIIERIEA